MLPDVAPISVRVLSVREKVVEVHEGIQNHYRALGDPMPSELPYRSKALFVFQKNDDVDLCFFG